MTHESSSKELPRRSATGIHRLLKKEFPGGIPCEWSIRKSLATNGLSGKGEHPRKGYQRFTREHSNDLWQVDIAGSQCFGHLCVLHLHAFLNDHYQLVPAGKCFPDTDGTNVFEISREAFVEHSRPN